jgi:hypothetical protein
MSHSQDGLMAVITIGLAMRTAQKRYFQTRDKNDLQASKALERDFDRAVDAVLPPAPAGLFQDQRSNSERT